MYEYCDSLQCWQVPGSGWGFSVLVGSYSSKFGDSLESLLAWFKRERARSFHFKALHHHRHCAVSSSICHHHSPQHCITASLFLPVASFCCWTWIASVPNAKWVWFGLDLDTLLALFLQWNSVLALTYLACELYGIKTGDFWDVIWQKSNGQCLAIVHLPLWPLLPPATERIDCSFHQRVLEGC
jgi:hypothetical protein